jgi:hypothetical protein
LAFIVRQRNTSRIPLLGFGGQRFWHLVAVRKLTLLLVAVAFIVYGVVFGLQGVRAVIFFMPFTMTPFAIIACLACLLRSHGSQMILVFATLGYAAWFAYVYIDAMVIHLDPQSPIAFLFVVVYAAPILIVLWLLAYAFELAASSHLTSRCR